MDRRAALTRLGLAAGAAYLAPTLAVLKSAGASSNPGPGGGGGGPPWSNPSKPTRPSGPSRPSRGTKSSRPSNK